MTRAFRKGWVIGVPAERKEEWLEDVAEMMEGNEEVGGIAAAVMLVGAVRELNWRLFVQQSSG